MKDNVFNKLYEKIRLLRIRDKEPYFSLYKLLGFYPDSIEIYQLALLHKSSSVEKEKGKRVNNERLEFLGDAILDAVAADTVYHEFKNKREGFLTNTRAKLVQRETLNRVALELGLDKMVVFNPRGSSHKSHIYGNALEALIGAIYIDKGYDQARSFIQDVLFKKHINIHNLARKEVNFKSALIEWGQKNKITIDFDLLESFTDKNNNPIFQTQVMVAGVQAGVGIGFSKKESQQEAAKMAVRRLRSDKEFQHSILEKRDDNPSAQAASGHFEELPEEEHVNESDKTESNQ